MPFPAYSWTNSIKVELTYRLHILEKVNFTAGGMEKAEGMLIR